MLLCVNTDNESASVLVTGGAGFVGSHVVDRCVDTGWSVRVLDNLATGREANVARVRHEIDFRVGDIRDLETLKSAMEGIDLVFHLAALGSVPRSIADPASTHAVNATGTLNVLLAARDAQVSRVVFTSSSSVFGSNPDLPKVESMSGDPLSPYAASKRIGEDYCRLFNSLFALETSVVRFFNVFGPRQQADHAYAAVIPKFLEAALRGDPVDVHGDGFQSRDFTYVANAVDGLLALGDLANKRVAGEVFHLACGETFSLQSVLTHLESILGRPIERNYEPSRAGDIRHSLADTSKIAEFAGYQPQVVMSEGLSMTFDWFKGMSLS